MIGIEKALKLKEAGFWWTPVCADEYYDTENKLYGVVVKSTDDEIVVVDSQLKTTRQRKWRDRQYNGLLKHKVWIPTLKQMLIGINHHAEVSMRICQNGRCRITISEEGGEKRLFRAETVDTAAANTLLFILNKKASQVGKAIDVRR